MLGKTRQSLEPAGGFQSPLPRLCPLTVSLVNKNGSNNKSEVLTTIVLCF
jgi:hypothetical protein